VLRQFPDCSFVYAFFRARTLGYDVYPEDYFLRNFPWQQYGGLWIVNEARFARAEPINTLTAQALRRITGVGSFPQSSDSGSPTSHFTNSSFQHQPVIPADPRSNTCSQYSAIPAYDGSVSDLLTGLHSETNQPVFNMGGLGATLPRPEAQRPRLTLLTDVSRRYPGFPSPLSPTLSAKVLYPTPISDSGNGAAVPRVQSPAVHSIIPMSLDGSHMCGPSHRCVSHSYEHFAEQMGLIDSVLARSSNRHPMRPPSRPSTPSLSHTSPTSPPRALSPRAGMLRHMATRQALLGLSHSPPGTGLQHTPNAIDAPDTCPRGRTGSPSSFCSRSIKFPSPRLTPSQVAPPILPSIQIANGTEFETGSPISPTGTMLSYTSNRTVDSGLLAVPALSEPQVAEYRFWVPCGRRSCGFGCGSAHEGESAAAKRLFKGREDAVAQQNKDEVDNASEQREEDYNLNAFATSISETQKKSEVQTNWYEFMKSRVRDASIARV
jgi:hypothetical protein